MSIASELPPSLDLPPHLSAQKYFMVCTLTIAAWDSLVLSPRTWRLLKTEGWPVLKILFHFLRLFMPIEFAIVGPYRLSYLTFFTEHPSPAIAFFDTSFTQAVSVPISPHTPA
jgi:hypothetical protein